MKNSKWWKAALIVALFTGVYDVSWAASPIPIMRGTYAAQYAVISIFQVQPGRDAEFQNALLQSGPYNQLLPGFANERVVEFAPFSTERPAANSPTRVLAITRCADLETAAFVAQQRTPAVRDFLATDPTTLTVKLIEHQFSNWSWENPAVAFSLVTTPAAAISMANVQGQTLLQQSTFLFSRPNVSLSFLKDGYVGQLGMLDSFPGGTDLQSIRNQLQQRSGLMGASIYQAPDSRYLVYSEYFQAPTAQRASVLAVQPSTVEGSQLGVVVQNYVAR